MPKQSNPKVEKSKAIKWRNFGENPCFSKKKIVKNWETQTCPIFILKMDMVSYSIIYLMV